MITVHHLERSRSHRVLWLLEELGLPYEIVIYQRDRRTLLAPPELRAVHPLGKSPVVTDGGEVLAESGAILEALLERHGGGRLVPPAGTPERLRYRTFLHYAEGSVMPLLLLKLVSSKIRSSPVPFFMRPITGGIAAKLDAQFVDPQLALHFDYIEGVLAARPWFAGEEFTAADIQMSVPVLGGLHRAGLEGGRPNLQRFADAIRARPAFQRAVERGGPAELP